MLASFDCILLGGQTEGVPAHWVQDVETAQAFVTRNDVSGGVAFRMTNMQSGPARVRKHIEHIEFWLRRIEIFFAGIWRVKTLLLVPNSLPFRLDLVEGIWFTTVATHLQINQETKKQIGRAHV